MSTYRGVNFFGERISAAMQSATHTTPARTYGLDDGLDAHLSDDISYGDQRERSYVISPSSHRGWLSHSYGDEELFNRIYVLPSSIDFGFITEETTDTINVWNAYLTSSKDITDVVLTGHTTGISLDNDTPPITLSSGADKTFTVTMAASGPPRHSSIYTFTIDGSDYAVTIIGVRVIAVTPCPNWQAGVSVGYEFDTILFSNAYFVEQRRPLTDNAWRTVRARFILSGNDGHKLFNLLSYGHDKLFAVPIYTEAMVPSEATAATMTITIPTCEYFWNVQNRMDYAMLVDHDEDLAEVKEISTVANTTLTTATDITETFTIGPTLCYPVLIATVSSLRVLQQTDDVDVVDVEFREYING